MAEQCANDRAKAAGVTIVGFGDSITQAVEVSIEKTWLSLLGTMLRDRWPKTPWTMINAGIGGNTSREGLARMEKDVLSHRPNWVLIEFGGNDATNESHRHVSRDEFRTNLCTMRDRLRDISAKMALVMFPPVIDAWHSWTSCADIAATGGPDRTVEQYRETTRQLAHSEKLPLADIDAALRTACKNDATETFIRSCGVHLTEAGNRVVAKTVFDTLAATEHFPGSL